MVVDDNNPNKKEFWIMKSVLFPDLFHLARACDLPRVNL